MATAVRRHGMPSAVKRTIQGTHVCPVMFGELYACGSFLPELQVPINAASQQEILILRHSYLRDCVPVHKAFLIHLRTGQSSQVRLLVLKNLQTQAQISSCELKLCLCPWQVITFRFLA